VLRPTDGAFQIAIYLLIPSEAFNAFDKKTLARFWLKLSPTFLTGKRRVS